MTSLTPPPDTHSEAAIESRLLRVRGRVQGVGFRDACIQAAQALGLTGWVRNRRDGSVELLAQGRAELLDRLQAWLPRGAALARVGTVEAAAPEDPAERFDGFERWPTA